MMDNEESGKVRVSHSLNDAETDYVTKRKKTCQKTLQNLGINCTEDEVPNIAVIGSGGGLRAMVALLGSLGQLKESGLLDAIMYLSGVSGSTWAMASLYKEKNWSNILTSVKDKITDRLVKRDVLFGMQIEKLKKYYQKDNFSLTDVWAVYISGIIQDIDEHFLTEQRNQHDADPYPIFTVIDKQCKYDKQNKEVWFEITPDESGFSLGGAFVDTACFGSAFMNGKCTKNCHENDMLYLQGLCGSILAEISEVLKHIWNWLKNLVPWISQSEKAGAKECKFLEAFLHLNLVSMDEKHNHLSTIQDLLKDEKYAGSQLLDQILELKNKNMTEKDVTEFIVSACNEFQHFDWITDIKIIFTIMKLLISYSWGTTYNIVRDMNVEDIISTVLKTEIREYEDAGLLLNSPYFSVLRNHRKVDLIISLDFSNGDPFKTVTKAAELCKELNIPFPTVSPPDPKDLKEPKDFYVYTGSGPVVIHIPLFNKVNCNGEKEIRNYEEEYATTVVSYTCEMITNLMAKSASNITTNKEKLLNVIKDIINQKKKE